MHFGRARSAWHGLVWYGMGERMGHGYPLLPLLPFSTTGYVRAITIIGSPFCAYQNRQIRLSPKCITDSSRNDSPQHLRLCRYDSSPDTISQLPGISNVQSQIFEIEQRTRHLLINRQVCHIPVMTSKEGVGTLHAD